MSGETLTISEIEALARGNGWTTTALCKAVGIPPSYLSRWRRGANGMTVGTYEKLLAAAKQRQTEAA